MDFGALKCDSETTASSSSIKQNLVRILPISFHTHKVIKIINNLVTHSLKYGNTEDFSNLERFPAKKNSKFS